MTNSFMYRSTTWDGNAYYSSEVLPNASWVHEMIHTLTISGHANTLWCDDAKGKHYTYSGTGVTCLTKGYGDPYSIMGARAFATDVDCYTKFKLGWLAADQMTVVALANTAETTVTITPLNDKAKGMKCLVLEIPNTKVATNLIHTVDRLYVEYRTPVGIDRYLNWLKDGSSRLKRYVDYAKVDIEGVMVRVASSNKREGTVNLFDAHPDTLFKSSSIKISYNQGRMA